MITCQYYCIGLLVRFELLHLYMFQICVILLFIRFKIFIYL